MPGVVVTTGVRVGPAGAEAAPASSYFIVGDAERGPTDESKLIRSMVEFERWYGNYTSSGTLYQHAQTFFEEGGTRIYAMRVVATDAVAASVSIPASTSGNAIEIAAANEGAWGNNLSVRVATGFASGTYRLTVTLDDVTVFSSGDLEDATEGVNSLNNAIPYLVSATIGGGTGGVDTTPDTYDLTSGTNGVVPTADAAYVTALGTYFGAELGAGVVAIPERFGTEIWNGLRDHAEAHNRIAFCGLNDLDGAQEVIVDLDVLAYYGANVGERVSGSYMAFFFPHVKAPDGSGGVRTMSPESFAAAARARAHLEVGPWRAGAGIISSGRFVTGVSQVVTKATGDTLDAARINAIRVIDNQVRVYGARSISGDEDNWRYITYRDLVNYVTTTAEAALEDYVFSVIDGRKTIFAKVASELVSILEPIREGGGLFERIDDEGRPIDRGYSVDVSNALNPVADLATGLVRANVGIRVSGVSDMINVTITKSGLATAV